LSLAILDATRPASASPVPRVSPDTVQKRIRRVVAHGLAVASDDLVSDVSLRDELAVDSLDMVELGLALEREFSVVCSDRDLTRVRSYGDLVGMVLRLLATQRARRSVDGFAAGRAIGA